MNLYQILGVSKDASQADIKKAYRRLAKKYHPDTNQGNEQAAEEFKKVAMAYKILGDEEQRGRYDRGEIDEQGREINFAPGGGFHGFGGAGTHGGAQGTQGFADMDDILSELFGLRTGGRRGRARTMQQRGADVRYRLRVGLLDACRGTTQRLTLGGGKTLDVRIPAGIEDGQQIRLKGQGQPGIGGGPAGDALVEIQIVPHPVFRREGLDIHIDLPISLPEGVLGGKVNAPTIHGEVALKIPPGSDGTKTMRLRGKGIHTAKGEKGDQIVHLRLVLPKKIDKELEDFMREWGKKNAYDVRASLREAI